MKSKLLAQTLGTLGVTKSHSRPYVSDDNPFSESQFKTLKYRPDFPQRFDSLAHAEAHCRDFVEWYNHEHWFSPLIKPDRSAPRSRSPNDPRRKEA